MQSWAMRLLLAISNHEAIAPFGIIRSPGQQDPSPFPKSKSKKMIGFLSVLACTNTVAVMGKKLFTITFKDNLMDLHLKKIYKRGGRKEYFVKNTTGSSLDSSCSHHHFNSGINLSIIGIFNHIFTIFTGCKIATITAIITAISKNNKAANSEDYRPYPKRTNPAVGDKSRDLFHDLALPTDKELTETLSPRKIRTSNPYSKKDILIGHIDWDENAVGRIVMKYPIP
uniref:Uncharacterized protein n=1 Tax=Glossina pallidipes TaxID=7398 RepID=A0A1A9ZAK7_GLOPL